MTAVASMSGMALPERFHAREARVRFFRRRQYRVDTRFFLTRKFTSCESPLGYLISASLSFLSACQFRGQLPVHYDVVEVTKTIL